MSTESVLAPSITTMEPSLKDKTEFFQQLAALQDIDDDSDAMPAAELLRRQEFRAFGRNAPDAAVATESKATSPILKRPSGFTPRRTVSDPVPAEQDSAEVIIVKATPAVARRDDGRKSFGTSIVLDSQKLESSPSVARKQSRQPTRSVSHPLPKPKHARSSSGGSSASTKTGKRKRDSLKMVPERLRIFSDLRFFYIPNDDISPVRRMRITKAREHGVTWTRDIADATHIIVDKGLLYNDIERILKAEPSSSEKILVNEEFPLDCIQFGVIVNHLQNHYQVCGTPSKEEPSAASTDSASASDKSLQLKPPTNNPTRWDYVPPPGTPERSDRSTQVSTTSAEATKVIPSSQPEEMITNTSNPSPLELVTTVPRAAARELPMALEPRGSQPNDELSKYIDLEQEFRNVPLEDDEEEDGDGSTLGASEGMSSDLEGSSEDERQRKKRKASSKKIAGQQTHDWQQNFGCMKGGTRSSDSENPNTRTIEVLQKMCDYYTRINDHWRTTAYRKVISTLRQQDHKICTEEEALKLPNVGTRLAKKIEEIVSTDGLKRLEYAQKETTDESLQQFLKIYDVGLSQATKWISQGYRTLHDLREKAKLTTNQRIGLEHYDDLNTRIPRRQVQALGNCVKYVANQIDPRVELLIGGSYRRGSESSGDIDLIITRKGTISSEELVPFLTKLIDNLADSRFLTATLASLHHNAKKGHGSKWHGCCVLPRESYPGPDEEYQPTWRRIDFLLVPESEYGAALIYFTGNDIFNRSMRLLASKKGMRLNQRGLYRDVMRGPSRVKLTNGDLVEGRDEKKIFEILGVHWREPHERWC